MPPLRAVSGPLAIALIAVAVFWITAGVSDFFLDRPFTYTVSTEWSENFIRSRARFPGSDELALHMISAVLLVPALIALSVFGVRVGESFWERWSRVLRVRSRLVVLGLACVATVAAASVAFLVLRQTLLIDDERAYAFQATLFGQGRTKLPDAPAAFRNPMFLTAPWMGKYSPGQSLLLLPGALLGTPHLILPLCAGALVLVTYGFVREIHGEREALLGATLIALSPFVWCASGTLMPFTSTALAVVGAFWCFAHARRTRSWMSHAGAGACLGMAFLLRPFDAVALGLPLGVWLLASARGREAWVGGLAFAAGAAPFLAVFLGFNWLTLGSPWKQPYTAANDFALGFYVQSLPGIPYVHTPSQGIATLTAALIRLDLWLFGWPGALFLVLVSGLAARQVWDRFLLLVIAVFFVSHTVVVASGTWDVGPTYFLPVAPFLVVLALRGLGVLRQQFALGSLAHRALGWLPIAGAAVALVSVVPIRLVRLSALASEIRAPWTLIREARLGDSIVVLPSQKQMEAAGYALGYPYELASGSGTAHLIRPFSKAELEEACRVLGQHLPVYLLRFDHETFQTRGIRRYSLER